jgi:photosystem II stability/assembly factor-like uncharacterized protein
MKRIFLTTLLLSLAGLLSLIAQERVYTPELSLPVNGAIDQMPDVILDWNAVTGGNTGIIKYDIQLDTDPALASPENFETEFLSGLQMDPLVFGETYYWRVRAKDGNNISDWSEIWSFRVIRRVLLTAPGDASTQSTDVEFAWGEVTGITEYDLQIDQTYYWNEVNSGQTSNLTGISVLDATHAWTVGAGGLVLFYDGTSWAEQESSITTDIYSVSFTDANNGWAVGKGGKIIYYNGTLWATQTPDTIVDLYGVHMLDASNGWAVGKGGVVLFYNGSSWSKQYVATKDLNKVFALDATHVWAVGKSGLIIYFNGTGWAPQETGGTIKEFLNVGFASASDGWAIGKTGFMMHFDGSTWSEYKQVLSPKDLTGIFFISPENAWIVGKTGTVFQYDGIDWFSQTGGTTANLSAVGFSGTTGFIAGDAGTLIAYNDNAFSNPFSLTIPGEYLTATVTNFPFGETFFWRMRCKHASSTSEWSGARSFVIQATVELDKPNNHAVNQNLNVELRWDIYSEEVTYEIEIDDNNDFSSPIFLSSLDNTINAEGLHFGAKYYWHVRALHASDISDWSEVWDFTAVNTIELVSPEDNAVEVNLSPLLDWKEVTGISNYYMEVSDKSDFSTIVVSGTAPADQSSGIVPLLLEKNKMYYWRVRAENGIDHSGWSPVWKFTTIPPVGINEPSFSSHFNIYPNPVTNMLFLDVKTNKTLRLSITDVLGNNVAEREIVAGNDNPTIQVDISTLQEGLYLIRLSSEGESFTKKIVIKR